MNENIKYYEIGEKLLMNPNFITIKIPLNEPIIAKKIFFESEKAKLELIINDSKINNTQQFFITETTMSFSIKYDKWLKKARQLHNFFIITIKYCGYPEDLLRFLDTIHSYYSNGIIILGKEIKLSV